MSSTKAFLPIALKSYVAVLTEKNARELDDISNPVRVRHLPTEDFGSDIGVETLAMTGKDRFAPDYPIRHRRRARVYPHTFP